MEYVKNILLVFLFILNYNKAGCTNSYEIAAYLDVTEEFLNDAIDKYTSKYEVNINSTLKEDLL